MDPVTGLVQMKARWYDPDAGIFISEDPRSYSPTDPFSLHEYLYANADPVNWTDPTGEKGEKVTLYVGDGSGGRPGRNDYQYFEVTSETGASVLTLQSEDGKIKVACEKGSCTVTEGRDQFRGRGDWSKEVHRQYARQLDSKAQIAFLKGYFVNAPKSLLVGMLRLPYDLPKSVIDRLGNRIDTLLNAGTPQEFFIASWQLNNSGVPTPEELEAGVAALKTKWAEFKAAPPYEQAEMLGDLLGTVGWAIVAGKAIESATTKKLSAPDAGSSSTQPAKKPPKASPNFKTPTNPAQPPPKDVPRGWRVRQMSPTEQYPNGYWVLEKPMKDGSWQPIDPSTMKPGTRPETHVPLPPKKE